MDNEYWYSGKVNVPAEQREQFNADVLEILKQCGIRKIKEILVGNKEVTVTTLPCPDENGIVTFDYSIFEQKLRKPATYNTNDCTLKVEDRGGNEYGVAMNLILVLQESYSNGSGYVMHGKNIMKVYGYMALLSTLLNRKIWNRGRENLARLLLALRQTPDGKGAKLDGAMTLQTKEFDHFWGHELDACLDLLLDYDGCDYELESRSRFDINCRSLLAGESFSTRRARIIIYNVLRKEYIANKSSVIKFVKSLVHLSFEDRKELAKESGEKGFLAECSLSVSAYVFIASIAAIEKCSIDDIWKEFGMDVYDDYIVAKECLTEADAKWERTDLYPIICRNNQDEFIELWDGENLTLSTELQQNIAEWKQRISAMKDNPDLDVEATLGNILEDMTDMWKCRFVEESFVSNILSHKEQPEWRKALLVLQEILYSEPAALPELDGELAIYWSWSYRDQKADAVMASAYCSLLANDTQRKCVFGF